MGQRRISDDIPRPILYKSPDFIEKNNKQRILKGSHTFRSLRFAQITVQAVITYRRKGWGCGGRILE